MDLATRVSYLGGSALEFLAKAKKLEASGVDVVHFEIGEPDFDTPRNIKEAAKRALDEGYTHYTPSQGIPELREAIAEHERDYKGIPVDPSRVVVSPGAKVMIMFALQVLVNEGDEVIYPDPGYTAYKGLIMLAGGKPVPLELRAEEGFEVNAERLESLVTSNTKLIILNSPGNPTGNISRKHELDEIARIALERGLYVISDEVYSRIIYDGEHLTIASIPGMMERTVIVDGFSKTYAMTGWRLGYGIMPEEMVRPLVRLQSNSVSCATAFVQKAGVEALRGDQGPVEEMVAEFRRRRDRIFELLGEIPHVKARKSEGAFYVFLDIRELGMSSREFASYLLEKHGVCLLPGDLFGERGEGYVRISYATSMENIEKGIERIARAVREIAG
ncbi:MAG: pyridoxal phosphate-dependent aminotransferase [Candidatus Hydrothermota bacterium]|nr:MAG: pyridoxal phosphate-dependent aminotransferase [Candidatus Hydrothermae bacterium]